MTTSRPTAPSTDGIRHRTVRTNGIEMHVAELTRADGREPGPGPTDTVVLLHGFPHLWATWRRQMPVLADAGWRVIAPDLRGFGGSSAPTDPAEYGAETLSADLTGLLDALGEDRAVFVGLDFGIDSVWNLALREPERIRAAIGMNNPFLGRSPVRPSDVWASMARKHFLHIQYFLDDPDAAAADLASRPDVFLRRVYWALSGQYWYFRIWEEHAHPGNHYVDVLPEPPALPWDWLREDELAEFVAEYTRTGFLGGLNWYRAMDLRWEENARFADARLTVPTYFLAGEKDLDLEGFHGVEPLERFRSLTDDLREVVLVPGAGHLVNLERSDLVSDHLVRFLEDVRATT